MFYILLCLLCIIGCRIAYKSNISFTNITKILNFYIIKLIEKYNNRNYTKGVIIHNIYMTNKTEKTRNINQNDLLSILKEIGENDFLYIFFKHKKKTRCYIFNEKKDFESTISLLNFLQDQSNNHKNKVLSGILQSNNTVDTITDILNMYIFKDEMHIKYHNFLNINGLRLIDENISYKLDIINHLAEEYTFTNNDCIVLN